MQFSRFGNQTQPRFLLSSQFCSLLLQLRWTPSTFCHIGPRLSSSYRLISLTKNNWKSNKKFWRYFLLSLACPSPDFTPWPIFYAFRNDNSTTLDCLLSSSSSSALLFFLILPGDLPWQFLSNHQWKYHNSLLSPSPEYLTTSLRSICHFHHIPSHLHGATLPNRWAAMAALIAAGHKTG